MKRLTGPHKQTMGAISEVFYSYWKARQEKARILCVVFMLVLFKAGIYMWISYQDILNI